MTSKEYLKQIATTEVIDCTNNDKSKKRIANIFPIGISVIEKDLEILYMLKKNMKVETEVFESDNEVVEYEYIAYNGWNLDIENKEEYNKIKEWLLK